MISKGDKFLFGIIGIGIMLLFVFWKDVQHLAGSADTVQTQKSKKGKDDKKKGGDELPDVAVLQKWELPSELKEVSGIAYMDEQRFACIQDEDGIIFIFNTASGKIEERIPFAGPGDYEGIALKGNTAFVVRADGKVYEVDMKIGESSTKEYNTFLTAEQNVEGLFYEPNKDRLLLAIKGDEPGAKDYKGVYEFDLSKKTLLEEPVFKIDSKGEDSNKSGGKKQKSVMPSELAIHPLTNKIYITDGPAAKLLVMDGSGKFERSFQLGKEFVQAEGLTFSPKGEVFISNEGTKQPANILKVSL